MHLFFTNEGSFDDITQMIADGEALGWKMEELEFGSVDEDEPGIYYCPNADWNGWEWYFVERDNEAMLFKLTYS